MKRITIGFICLLTLLSSCTTPTTVCKGIIDNAIQNRSNGYIKMKEFIKTDAVSGKAQDIEYYEIRYAVTVKCVKDGGWLDGQDKKLYSFDVWPTQCQTFNDGLLGSPTQHCHNIATKVDDEYVYTGSMILTKHENGWQQEKNNY